MTLKSDFAWGEGLQRHSSTMSPSSAPGLSPQPVREAPDAPDFQRQPELCMEVTPNPRLVALGPESSVAAQAFRGLAARLRQLQKSRGIKKVLITSSIAGEGKTVLSANLALTLARRQRVLLIDGDLRRSGLRELLDDGVRLGISEWWQAGGQLADCLCPISGLSMWYLPCGHAQEEPLEILQSQKLSDTLRELSEHFDWMIVDSPPLVPLVDSQIWATHVDASLLVVREGKTPKKLLKKALDGSDHLKLLGVVTNDHQDGSHPYYGRYYAQGYGAKPRRVQHFADSEDTHLPRTSQHRE